jgi:predicted hotdog family 3-hydroxylacyl-ACP dehydratase
MLYSGENLIPHKPPMLFIDGVSLSAECALAYAVVREDWVVLDGAGKVHPAAFFELMAQGFAAISAAQSREDPGELAAPALGFLVGVKKFDIYGDAIVGDRLAISVQNHMAVERFHVFDALVKNERDELLASGQIKIFLAGESVADKIGGTRQ